MGKKIGNGVYTVWSGNIEKTPDGGYIICGTWTKFNPSYDAFIIKLNACAEVEWCKTLITPNNYDMGHRWATKTFDNKIITVGSDATGGSGKIYAVKVNSDLEYDSIYTQPFTYDSLCPHPIFSTTEDPVCDNVYVGIDEPFKSPETTKLKIFPNPASDHLTVEMPKYLVVSNTSGKIPSITIYHQWGSVLLEIYDLFGKKILEKQVVRSETLLEIDVLPWPTGIYLCRLTFNKQTVGSAKVVVE